MLRKSYRVVVPFFCAALCLGLWYVAARADDGSHIPGNNNYGSGAPLPDGAFAGLCDDWTQVNDGAFGVLSTAHSDKSGDYYAEDGFEVVVYNGQLYVGMEADDAYGAQLWRSKTGVSTAVTQTDWEEVAQVGGMPFGNGNAAMDESGVLKLQNDHIDSLASFNGVLYASTANGGYTEQGALVYSSTTGASGTWVPVIDAGFGFTHNVNFKDMQVFQGWLCGGTQNSETGAQVWCTQDGRTWVQKNYGGFGNSADDPDTVEVWSGHVYSDALYFGTQRATPSPNVYQGVLYRTETVTSASPLWTPVYTSPANGYRIDILGDVDGFLYISYRDTTNGVVILRSENGGTSTWVPVNIDGMDNDNNNTGTVVDGATIYNGMLYCAMTNIAEGTQVWRTDGISQAGMLRWTQVSPSGLGHTDNRTAELIPWNGYLYAWTSNYVSGQEVRRTSCSICQAQAIDGLGRYDFTAVGTTLTFTAETLDTATICVKPNLMPVDPQSGSVLSRTIELLISPQEGNFKADIAFSYEPQELDPSAASSTTLYLRNWIGEAWVTACAGDHTGANRTILCRDISTAAAWVVSGTPGTATTVKLVKLRAGSVGIVLGLLCSVCVILFVWQYRARQGKNTIHLR
ncbi:MAG: hypothetical protein E4H27_00520 [Anaerolineales bacterium]|nr:MAG: hypothetical protein E4H27_00520 [Anaerolineales bacterium]